MAVVSVYLLCLALPLIYGGPLTYRHGTTSEDQIVPRDTNGVATPTSDRRTVTDEQGVNIDVAFQCTSNTSCYPEGFENMNYTIPTDLVWCSAGGVCQCYDCFYSYNDSCSVMACHHFDNGSRSCVDDRKSQKKTLLLSVFLSSMGVANLSIGQYILGYVQFGIFLLVLNMCICIYCTKKCFIKICKFGEEEFDCYDCCEEFCSCCHELCATIYILSLVLGLILCFMTMAAWWAADLAAFVENTRLDGDGCPLRYDL